MCLQQSLPLTAEGAVAADFQNFFTLIGEAGGFWTTWKRDF